jgi:hypothetical protein
MAKTIVHSKKQFCLRGHDISIVGRTKSGNCKQCKLEDHLRTYLPHPISKVQFCPKGHDKDLVGTYSDGSCILCKKEKGIERRKDPSKDSRLKQICLNGHDTFICGRKDGCCNICREEYLKIYVIEHKEKMQERSKEHYENNRDELLVKHRKYNQEHKEESKIRNKKWRKDHPEIEALIKLRQDEQRKLREVSWGQEGMQEFYRNKPKGMTGDHVIPLQAAGVFGLHVIWNLQYMTHLANSTKKNKCTPMEATKFYEKILIEAGLKEQLK